MKVAMLAGALPDYPCGVGDYTFHLSQALTEKGIEVGVFTSKTKELNKSLANFEVFPIMESWELSEVKTLLATIKQYNPDVIHIQYPGRQYSSRTVYILPLIFRLYFPRSKIVVTLHEYSTLKGPLRYKHLFSALIADRIIVVNECYMEDLSTEVPFIKKKIRHIRVGAGVQPAGKSVDKRGIRNRFGVNNAEILLAYFGFVNPDKGVDDLIRAISQLPNGHLIKLLIIGEKNSNSEYQRFLDDLSQSFDLQENIIWTGYTEPQRVSDYLQDSDIAVFPFKNGVCEKRSSFISVLAHGLPVVTTVNPDITPDIYQQYLLLAKPNDPNSLAQVLEDLIASGEKRKKYSQLALELSAFYTWEKIAEKTINVYGEILCNKG